MEQTFGTLKRRFQAARSRYMTRRNVEAELAFKATALNLLKAANRIELAAACGGSLPIVAQTGKMEGGEPLKQA